MSEREDFRERNDVEYLDYDDEYDNDIFEK